MALGDVFQQLPSALRDQVEGYVRFVSDISEDLFQARHIERSTDEQQQTLLTVAAAWRLWEAVDSQYWLLVSSLALLEREGVSELAVGRNRYSRRSRQFRDMTALRDDLVALFGRLGLDEIRSIFTLNEITDFAIEQVG
jgi:hypothetical protein